MEKRIYTAESVTSGHPDKLADLIADSILDECLKTDPESHVACEVMLSYDKCFISGEITTTAKVDYEYIARRVIAEVGYDTNRLEVEVKIHNQSQDIAQAVNKSDNEVGAGDQGVMFGYATNETLNFMPLPIELAHRLTSRLEYCRKTNEIEGLLPDGKSQVSIEYINDRFSRITSVIVSAQHEDVKDFNDLVLEIKGKVIAYCLAEYDTSQTEILINPSGRFVLGGFEADTGLTGRKLMVDSYGGNAHHGGGAMCVDSETEYLTLNGWKKFDKYNNEDIAQWDNGVLSFIKPSHYHCNAAEKMYYIRNRNNVDMVLSENHDMVFTTSKGNIVKKRVKDVLAERGGFLNGFTGRIPSSFKYKNENKGVELTDDEIRLQVTFCADGTIMSKNGRIRIKKGYKITRLEQLLESSKMAYRKSEDEEYVMFYFQPLIKNRLLYECFKNANSRQLQIIADECLLWDGDCNKIYRTTKKPDADFVQFALMLRYGTNVSITTDDRQGEQYGKNYIRKSILYTVRIKEQKDFGLRDKKEGRLEVCEYVPKNGKMYCFTVPSGMLVLRRENKIFITGNCGKDPSKVDRSGAYMARYVAKNIVASGLAEKCEVMLSYAIGKAEPTAVDIDTFYTGAVSEELIKRAVLKVFDLTPRGIIESLELKKPIYASTAVGGHFGNDKYSWEKLDKVEELKNTIIKY